MIGIGMRYIHRIPMKNFQFTRTIACLARSSASSHLSRMKPASSPTRLHLASLFSSSSFFACGFNHPSPDARIISLIPVRFDVSIVRSNRKYKRQSVNHAGHIVGSISRRSRDNGGGSADGMAKRMGARCCNSQGEMIRLFFCGRSGWK